MKKDTIAVSAGRHPEEFSGAVNTPVFRASTVLFPTLRDLEESDRRRFDTVKYGRMGTPTTFAFEEAIARLEGADRTIAVSSGLAACAIVLMAVARAGDHLLVVDSVYGPVRKLCDTMLTSLGVETTYYDPAVGAGIADLLRPNTRLVYLESPGSLTFDMQDVPAIVAACRKAGVLTAFDNTWATPLLFRPLEHGVDFSILAATKYVVGHSDAMLGAISLRAEHFETVKWAANLLGNCPGSEELYLGLRGLRTMPVRLQRHDENARRLAEWFAARPEVERVLYPALPDFPGHALWKRDFAGASGLFSVIFRPVSPGAVAAMVDHLEHFGIGASFGGYESLVLPARPQRTATLWEPGGPVLRFHIGLEDPEDLIADLEAGFERMAEARDSEAAE